MQVNLITVIPEFFNSPLSSSILGRAVKQGTVKFNILCLRDFADGKPGKKKIVDDTPYGGGAGMVLKVEPIVRALRSLEKQGIKGQVWLMDARGKKFTQKKAEALAKLDCLTIICGHYEGVDERVIHYVDAKISVGDFVLTGGEAASLIICDAAVRLLPGVLDNQESLLEESHGQDGALEYPHYTRPLEFEGQRVPEILLSGNHAAVAAWRKEQQS